MSSLDDEWKSFMNGTFFDNEETTSNLSKNKYVENFSDLNISTKTKIAFLNIENIDILNMFWKLNIMPYNERRNGITKKQIKISLKQEEKNDFIKTVERVRKEKIVNITNVKEIKKKYVCKLNIGLSKKDILKGKCNKGAFYNCFMLIIRVFYNGSFKEINAKVFNTGKLSFPGMITDELMELTMNTLLDEINAIYESDNIVKIKQETIETVLVNSNFTCGFYIVRDKLADILKSKYNIPVYYDSCSYPGIQCKYKFPDNPKKSMSFMIFRTGSVLIVGKCNDDELNDIYEYIKNILIAEYNTVSTVYVEKKKKEVVKKRKKRVIYVSKL
jgi:hypothetical protein